MEDLFQLDYFSILDIAWALLFLVLLLMYVNAKKKQYENLDYFKYYSTNIYLSCFVNLFIFGFMALVRILNDYFV